MRFINGLEGIGETTLSFDGVVVVGGGLAGSEAAWQASRRGVRVRLYEMRPERPTAVHKSGGLAELVCSNSLKSVEISTSHGVLKEEMGRLGSLILECAVENRVPAGGALAVDRDQFSAAVTARLEAEPLIEIVREEVTEIPAEAQVILAVGPLVSEKLAAAITRFTGQEYLYFFDAIAPVILAESIDREIVFAASRYDKGDGDDYLNCPMDQPQYEGFIKELLAGEQAPLHEFDKTPYFEGCMPMEVMAARGLDTPRFGPMKPVGLTDPRSGERPWAVVQLRQDNLAAEHYSMVGFQTQLRWPEQKRVFRMIPGLEKAEFERLGQVHRNCYINAPTVLQADLQARERAGLFFAGQISGVEGYTESAATGLLCGINAARLALGESTLTLPCETILGALCHYICHTEPEGYQPTNVSFGLLPEAPRGIRRRRERRLARGRMALDAMDKFIEHNADALRVVESST
jgi:methylenetetrahydrofolate--tRNA-(uracil-5-)-methyltransferase